MADRGAALAGLATLALLVACSGEPGREETADPEAPAATAAAAATPEVHEIVPAGEAMGTAGGFEPAPVDPATGEAIMPFEPSTSPPVELAVEPVS